MTKLSEPCFGILGSGTAQVSGWTGAWRDEIAAALQRRVIFPSLMSGRFRASTPAFAATSSEGTSGASFCSLACKTISPTAPAVPLKG